MGEKPEPHRGPEGLVQDDKRKKKKAVGEGPALDRLIRHDGGHGEKGGIGRS